MAQSACRPNRLAHSAHDPNHPLTSAKATIVAFWLMHRRAVSGHQFTSNTTELKCLLAASLSSPEVTVELKLNHRS
jgi:hypothetical protein